MSLLKRVLVLIALTAATWGGVPQPARAQCVYPYTGCGDYADFCSNSCNGCVTGFSCSEDDEGCAIDTFCFCCP
jgi:hypothetical protein